jgi:hypothetical protein
MAKRQANRAELRMASLGFSPNSARLAGFSYRSKMLETTSEWLLHG